MEIEGERCAGLVMTGGLVGFCQPGHDFTPDHIARRYRELVAAGVPGVTYNSDHDPAGIRKATVCAEAAARKLCELTEPPAIPRPVPFPGT